MASRGLEGIERLMRKIDAMPAAVRKAAGQEAFLGAEAIAAEMRAIAPRDDNPDNGEQVRDHIRVEEGRLGDMSYVVIADAKDEKGRPKAVPVELGHKASNGTIVEPAPFFWPTVRARRKGINRRIKSATTRAINRVAKS